MEHLLVTYSGYFIALIASATTYWQFRQRRKAEKQKEIRNRRYEVYTEYLSKIDSINSKLYLAQTSEEL